jgi:DNA polymerase I-like protein with 3'-5' exonuclease and polymerase domains
MNDNFLLILVAVASLAVVAVLVRRKMKLKLEAENQRNSDQLKLQKIDMRQNAVLKEMNVLGSLVDDKSLSLSELEIKSKSSFAILESYNLDGRFTGVINDVTQYVLCEIESKRLGKSG